MPLFAQAALPAPAPSGGGGIQINFPIVDWQTLIPQLVGYFFDAVGTAINDMTHKAFDGVWSSSVNVVGQTDMGSTWNFGPIHDQVLQVQSGARMVLLFALVLLGLKAMLGSIVPRHNDVVSEVVNGVLASVIMVAAFPVLVPQLIDFTNQVATAVGTVDLSRYMSNGFGGQNPMVEAVLFIVLVFFGLRLLFWATWRIMVLAVLLPVGMFAAAAYAVPFMRWLFIWWAKTWGGLLLAQIPSVMALTIGAQLFAHGSGLMAFMFSIAAMQVAVDIYKILPGAAAGNSGPPWGSLPWRLPLAAGGLGVGAGAAAASKASGAVDNVRPRDLADTYGYR
jgi:hypothetical protein